MCDALPNTSEVAVVPPIVSCVALASMFEVITLYNIALLTDKLFIDALNMDTLSAEILLADKLVTETLFIDASLTVILSTEILLADKLVTETLFIDALFITAFTETFNDAKLFSPFHTLLDVDKLFMAVVTYAVVAAFVELSLDKSVGAVNEIVKLLFPDHVLLEPSKFVPAFNVVCMYE